ncbi:MAG TPA: glycoside hydrolase family 30 beta sandwich domain-containing protein [Arachidicoccus sp.]|nr:glycoside hydrolase family 30 beta sandwich domain-containing protein [Arachidicoccus sp.]
MLRLKTFIYSAILLVLFVACAKDQVPAQSVPPANENSVKTYDSVIPWLTKSDQSVLFAPQKLIYFTDPKSNSVIDAIKVDSTKHYQEIDGFGFCLTDGSADLINKMSPDKKATLLSELFGTKDPGIGISYIRVSIGASDLSDSVYTYDDVPTGKTDKNLQHFTIAKAKINLIPVLRDILKINPDLKILGSPWSAPSWMKDNEKSKGGSLIPDDYTTYAQYFVRYIQDMKAAGIRIDAITPQNEPLNPDNNPSMYMNGEQQASFIRDALGPAFAAAGLDTKIIIYDHNADHPDYPLTILKDPEAAKFVDGSAFHLYAGGITALSAVHEAYPDKKIYFTEQYTPGSGSFEGDLSWHVKNLIIGATKNWSRNVLEWNLASDPQLGPHTPGGCTTCLGAVTIEGNSVLRNPSYYIIAHASKFVRPGSYRIQSSEIANISSVAFVTPEGKKVLITLNTSNQPRIFDISFKGKVAHAAIDPGAVATFVW